MISHRGDGARSHGDQDRMKWCWAEHGIRSNTEYPQVPDVWFYTSTSYGGVRSNPLGRLLNPLFSHSPARPVYPLCDRYGDSMARSLVSCCYFRRCARGRSWFIFVNRGEGGLGFYLGLDEFEPWKEREVCFRMGRLGGWLILNIELKVCKGNSWLKESLRESWNLTIINGGGRGKNI